jgi:hypothetical protein
VFHEYYSNISKIKDPSIQSLYAISKTMPWLTFNNLGFIEWAESSRHFNKEIWKHPDDLAHRAALNLVKDQLKILL